MSDADQHALEQLRQDPRYSALFAIDDMPRLGPIPDLLPILARPEGMSVSTGSEAERDWTDSATSSASRVPSTPSLPRTSAGSPTCPERCAGGAMTPHGPGGLGYTPSRPFS